MKAQTGRWNHTPYHFIVARLFHFCHVARRFKRSEFASLPPQQVRRRSVMYGLRYVRPLSNSQTTFSCDVWLSTARPLCTWLGTHTTVTNLFGASYIAVCGMESHSGETTIYSNPFKGSSRHLARGARTGDNSSSRPMFHRDY